MQIETDNRFKTLAKSTPPAESMLYCPDFQPPQHDLNKIYFFIIGTCLGVSLKKQTNQKRSNIFYLSSFFEVSLILFLYLNLKT